MTGSGSEAGAAAAQLIEERRHDDAAGPPAAFSFRRSHRARRRQLQLHRAPLFSMFWLYHPYRAAPLRGAIAPHFIRPSPRAQRAPRVSPCAESLATGEVATEEKRHDDHDL